MSSAGYPAYPEAEVDFIESASCTFRNAATTFSNRFCLAGVTPDEHPVCMAEIYEAFIENRPIRVEVLITIVLTGVVSLVVKTFFT